MRAMKLLFLTHRLPAPADRGCKQRCGAILEYLAARHQVWCAGGLDSPGADLSKLRAICTDLTAVPLHAAAMACRAAAGLLVGRTATQTSFVPPALSRVVRTWAREIGFDAVFAFSSSMADLAMHIPAARRVLCLDDLDSVKWGERARGSGWPMAGVYETESRRLAGLERRWIAGFDASLVVSEKEAALVEDPALRRRVHVIPAGLVGGDAVGPLEPAVRPVVGFLGAMDYAPNIEAVRWFAQRAWPTVRTMMPQAEFLVVGRSPAASVQQLHGTEGIEVTGTVEHIEPYLARMRVHVAPLREAHGVQIKVLTAMRAGIPCVVSSAVADGIGAVAGADLLIAEGPGQTAGAVLKLLANDHLARRIGAAGRDFVVRRLGTREGLERIEHLLFGGPADESSQAAWGDQAAAAEAMCMEGA